MLPLKGYERRRRAGGYVAGGFEMCGTCGKASSSIAPSKTNCLHRMHQDAITWIGSMGLPFVAVGERRSL